MSHSKPVQRTNAQENNDDDEIVEDHLEVDKPVPGQNFTCVSFISPEKEFEIDLAEAYYNGHPEALEFSASLHRNSKKEFNENQIELTDHAHGGGKNIFMKLDRDLGEQATTTIVRMVYKEAQTLKTRTPVIV